MPQAESAARKQAWDSPGNVGTGILPHEDVPGRKVLFLEEFWIY